MFPELVMAPDASVPANVTFAPLNVADVVVPYLIIKLPLVFDKAPNCTELESLKTALPPSASKNISPATSNMKSPELFASPFDVVETMSESS